MFWNAKTINNKDMIFIIMMDGFLWSGYRVGVLFTGSDQITLSAGC